MVETAGELRIRVAISSPMCLLPEEKRVIFEVNTCDKSVENYTTVIRCIMQRRAVIQVLLEW